MKLRNKVLYHYFGSLLAILGLLFFFTFFLFSVAGIGDVGMGKLFGNPVAIITGLLLILIVPVSSVIFFRSEEQASLLAYMNRSMIRYVVAFLLFFYGYTKMYHKFFEITYLALDTRLADVDSFNLVWYFFGRSNVQEFMIGLLEFVPALLLLFRRTSFLAYVLLFPVALNVLMVNTFNHVSGFTFPLSIYIVLSDIYLLYGHKKAIAAFLMGITEKPKPELNKSLNVLRWSMKLWIFGTMVFLLVASIVTIFFNKGTSGYSQRNKFTGGYELQQLTVNDTLIHPDTSAYYYKSIYIEPQSRWNAVITFSRTLGPKAITIRWNRTNDSVFTYLKKVNYVTQDALDSSTAFAGTYRVEGSSLLINGIQYGKAIRAKYIKKDLPEYKWFW